MKVLLFIAVLSILAKSAFTLKCCLGVSVNSFSTSCRINMTCVEGSSCAMYETSGLNVVVRGCGEKQSCGNTIEGSEIAGMFEKLGVPVLKSIEYPSMKQMLQNIEFPSIEVKCCDTDYCNGCGLLKGNSFVLVVCAIVVKFVV